MTGWVAFTLSAAFLAGLAGGVHCGAMCGPLIGAVCGSRGAAKQVSWLRFALAYNSGRIASYCAAGALAGGLGAAGLALRAGPAAQQALLAIMSASLILLAAYVGGMTSLARAVEAGGAVIWRRIEPLTRWVLPADTPPRAFGLGLIWGWLPCGMVYVALLAAAASADPLQGAGIMAAFGLGTLPNVLAISASLGYFRRLAKGRFARLVCALIIGGVGLAGLARAAQPVEAAAGSSWCLTLPAISALFTGGH